MSQPKSSDYYRLRAEASRDLAQRAVTPSIAAIHTETAIRYEGIATQIDGRAPATTQAA